MNPSQALKRLVVEMNMLLGRILGSGLPQDQLDKEVSDILEVWKAKYPEFNNEDHRVTMKYINGGQGIKVNYSDSLLMMIDEVREEMARNG